MCKRTDNTYMKLQITKTFGNFHVTATCEPSEAQVKDLASLGALYLFERTPSTQVEQQVFAPMLGWSKGERGTSYKRPADFKRNSVPFTDDVAEEIKHVYETTDGKIGEGNAVSFNVTSVVKHEGGETASEMVRATTFVDTMLGAPDREEKLRGMFGLLGLADAETATREELVAFAHEKKIGIQPTKAK